VKIRDCKDYLFRLFNLQAEIPEEFGFTSRACDDVKTVGYAVNLTPEIVNQAIKKKVNLIVTHHDAWDFIFGMKEHCLQLLREHGISHVFAHLPLDVADFGPVQALTTKLGAEVTDNIISYKGVLIGRVGVYEKPLTFAQLVKRTESVCREKVMSWRNNRRLVRRICVLPGGGHLTTYMKEAVENGCDTYITGEKTLYTIEYARFAGMNLIVGSHTFTEIPAVENLANLLKTRFPELAVVRLKELHLETQSAR
jgi:putative NIF3 family GTP cyclohydrolase 1 type 2